MDEPRASIIDKLERFATIAMQGILGGGAWGLNIPIDTLRVVADLGIFTGLLTEVEVRKALRKTLNGQPELELTHLMRMDSEVARERSVALTLDLGMELINDHAASWNIDFLEVVAEQADGLRQLALGIINQRAQAEDSGNEAE